MILDWLLPDEPERQRAHLPCDEVQFAVDQTDEGHIRFSSPPGMDGDDAWISMTDPLTPPDGEREVSEGETV